MVEGTRNSAAAAAQRRLSNSPADPESEFQGLLRVCVLDPALAASVTKLVPSVAYRVEDGRRDTTHDRPRVTLHSLPHPAPHPHVLMHKHREARCVQQLPPELPTLPRTDSPTPATLGSAPIPSFVQCAGGLLECAHPSGEGTKAVLSLAHCEILDRAVLCDDFSVAVSHSPPRGRGAVWCFVADGDAALDRFVVAVRAQQRAADPLSSAFCRSASGAWARRRPLQAELAPEDFEFLKILGRGSFGSVLKSRERRSQRVFACKVVQKKLLSTERRVQGILREVSLMERLVHPFVVRLHASFQTQGRLFLLLDFLPGGDLFFHIVNSTEGSEGAPPHLREDRAGFYAAEVAVALGFMHECGVAHRDLKAENVLLSPTGHCVLTDFGFACSLPPPGELLYERVGTEPYMSPELTALHPPSSNLPPPPGCGYSTCADWYAYGVTCFLLLTGNYAFGPGTGDSCTERFFDMLPECLPEQPNLSGPAREFLSSLLRRNRADRAWSLSSVLSLEFMQVCNGEAIARGELLPPPFLPDAEGSDAKYFPTGETGPAAAEAEAGVGHGVEPWTDFIPRGTPPHEGFGAFSTLKLPA
eukprot:Hpha_TRINITY_DN3886_c0_g1::TRINITY_DN3886_c0_g1_i1::g.44566::m.44566/K13302/SGK1; serum/glucocorticoid-regulated kinase 1